jgi:chromosome segregation ATPase
MSLELKEKILDLLERDREFRYAVAGLIGLDEILKRLDQHDRKFNEILAVLKEHTARLNEHDRKFNEIVARLDEHDKKFNEILSRLDEHDRKFNSIIAEIRDIRKELVDVKSYIERLSLTLEEEAWEVITSRLRRMGVDVKLTRLILPELEINIYGAVDDLCVLGEASTRVGVGVLRSVDEKLTELRRRYPEYLRRKVLKVVYTMWATEDAVEEAKKRSIWLLKALEDLTPPNI